MKRRTFSVEGEQVGQRLAAALARALPVPAAEAEALVRRGAVYVGGKRARDGGVRLVAGQTVMVVLEEGGVDTLARPAAPAPRLAVLLEDADVLAVDKPAGLTAQPTAGRVGDSLLDLATQHLGAPAGLVHRLDRETSGVTVFGKHDAATRALSAAFRDGTAKKRYLAACGPGLPPQGRIDLPLSGDPTRPGRWRATRQANGVAALTLFRTLFASDACCLVELLPQTGRTHQLRAHLTALGAPILGDARYGGARTAAGLEAPRCLLHAQALALPHPRTGAPLLLEAPVPDDLAAFFRAAGVTAPHGAVPDDVG